MGLATIQTIKDIKPIPNADSIEVATVLGWQVVIRKDDFKVGDKVIYCELDSWIPNKIAPFLSKGQPREFEGVLGERLKTAKLRGQISQGLILPLNILPEYSSDKEYEVGTDVSAQLGIIKWTKPVPMNMRGIIKGQFPPFIPKTDEIRIQSEPELLGKIKGKDVYITQKIDGTSATYYIKDGNFGVCSRNLELKDGDNIYWKIAKEYDLENKLRALNRNIALQGEIAGPGVQKNTLKLSKIDIFFFNVFDIYKYKYLDYTSMKSLLDSMGLKMVPLTAIHYSLPVEWTLEQVLSMSEIEYAPGVMGEGIVIRTMDSDPWISFKVLNNKYLLKNDE